MHNLLSGHYHQKTWLTNSIKTNSNNSVPAHTFHAWHPNKTIVCHQAKLVLDNSKTVFPPINFTWAGLPDILTATNSDPYYNFLNKMLYPIERLLSVINNLVENIPSLCLASLLVLLLWDGATNKSHMHALRACTSYRCCLLERDNDGVSPRLIFL